MKKHLCHLLAATAFFFAWQNVAAQNDSLLDLGRIKIRKDFAQTITIKGSDLQKIPFGTVSEVIAPWLHGAMTTRSNLVFVVDGNMVNDVNAWSIFDIEEITLVQNALVQVNGAIHQQQLVLVKTKRYTGESGFTFAGSSALARNDAEDPNNDKSETNFYHQYYIAARKRFNNIKLGASVNWLRDVSPSKKFQGLKTEKPWQLNRFRINGWLDVALAAGHSFSAGLNFVPQSVSQKMSHGISSLISYDAESRETLINPYVKLSNRIAKGLINELSVSYLSSRTPSESRFFSEYISPNPPNQHSSIESRLRNKFTNLLIREQISYSKKLGDWLLEPAVNFTYRSFKQTSDLRSASYNNNIPTQVTISTWKNERDSYVLTPSVGISYKNSFSLLGGVAASLTDDTKPVGDGVFPFASLTLDLLRVGNAENKQSLKIFGSWSQAPNFSDVYFSQQNISNESAPPMGYSPVEVFGTGVMVVHPFPEDAARRSIQTGAVFATAENMLQVSYNFDSRRYVDPVLYETPSPTGNILVVTWPDYTLTSHRLGIMARVVDSYKFEWSGGLNVTTFKTKMYVDQIFPSPFEFVSNNDKANWTGGLTNRFKTRIFSFGLDILYLLNEQRAVIGTYEKMDTWRISNLFAAWNHRLSPGRPLTLYVTARNSLQSEQAFFPGGNTQYFGAGATLQF